MASQKTDNGLLGSYPVEVEQQGDGSLRQVVKVGSVSASANLGSTAAVSNVTATMTSTTLKAANTNRIELVITNDSTATLYVLFGSGTASATNYSIKLGQEGHAFINTYNGQVNGVWSSATGAARITEVTP